MRNASSALVKAAALVVLAGGAGGLGGCQSDPASRPSPAPDTAPAAATGATPAVEPGKVSAIPTTLYKATPFEHDGYVVTLHSLSAEVRHGFTGEHSPSMYGPGWNVRLQLSLRDSREGRCTRIAEPVVLTSVVDEAGRELADKAAGKRRSSRRSGVFTYGGPSLDNASGSLDVGVKPGRLPNEFTVFRGEVVVEEVVESKTFEVPIGEPGTHEIVPSVRAVVRKIEPPAGGGDRFQSFTLTLETSGGEMPLVRSVVSQNPDGRIREIHGSTNDNGRDGVRRSEYNLGFSDGKQKGATARVDVVLAVREVRVPFEFRGVPVARAE
jgi:hypothetical protein